jgi:signal transduction histidine kinase
MSRLQHAPCGYIAFGDDYLIKDVNLEGERMLGFEHGKLLGMPVSEILTPRTRVYFSTHVYPALALHGAVFEAYVSLRRPNGAELAVLMNVVRRNIVGNLLMECVFMPMQRRRLFEQELIERRRAALAAARAEQMALAQLQAAQTKLAAQDQLASLGMLAAGVAHEIDNPLSYVTANLELLETRLRARADGDSELQGMLAEAREGVGRIRDIVSSLRTLSRMEETEQHVPVDLRDVVEVTARLAGNQMRHHSNFEISVPEQPVVVDGDAGRLGQVVLNLLVNAAQAVPESRASANIIRLSVLQEPTDGVIEVEDNGPGIPPHTLPRIFDPFFTTKPVGLGTGLGLSVCRGIMTSLGGTLTAHSAPGEGARFRVVLPLSAAALHDAQAAPSPEAPCERVLKTRPRVLAIDDDEHVTRVIALALQDFATTVVNRSEDALGLLAVEDFDVILCDLMMPTPSGIDIYRSLKQSKPALAERMIFLSGGSFSADADAFLTTCTNPSIRKPFGTAALNQACRDMALKAVTDS